jgi:hypothetical protein
MFFSGSPLMAHNNYFYVSPSFPLDFDIRQLPDGKIKTYLEHIDWENANPLLIKYKIKIP